VLNTEKIASTLCSTKAHDAEKDLPSSQPFVSPA
jgi:hypothetical protein